MKLLRGLGRRPPEIICQQWVEMVTDYLDGALPPELKRAADRHLDACPHCREYLKQMRRTIQIAGRLREEDVPEDVVDALAQAFQEFNNQA